MASRGNNVNDAILLALTRILENQENNNNNNNNNHEHRASDYTAIAGQIARSRVKTYDGTVNPVLMSEWIRDMEKNFTLYKVAEEDKVNIAAHFLEKGADRWWAMTGPTARMEPGFDWIRFQALLEARFYPQELKHQKIVEFLGCKQGRMSVQDYTDRSNQLSHYAKHLLPSENEKVFFYKAGLSAVIQSKVRRDPNNFNLVYNDALGAEISEASIAREASEIAKRPLIPDAFQSSSQKRFRPGGQAVVQGDVQDTGRMCFKCRKPYHTGKNCDGTPLGCFICKDPGHRAINCPKNVAGMVATASAPKPKGRIFVMSRAEVKAHPELITSTFTFSNPRVYILLIESYIFPLFRPHC